MNFDSYKEINIYYLNFCLDYCDRLLLKLFQIGVYSIADSRKVLLQSVKRLGLEL